MRDCKGLHAAGGRGFTLIEVVVVTAIITIMLGLIGLSIGRAEDQDTEQETKRLIGVIELASQDATYSGVPTALMMTAASYGIARYTADQWQPLTAPPAYAEHSLPEGMTLAMAVGAAAREPAAPVLAAVFMPTGEFELPALWLSNAHTGHRYEISQTVDGDVAYAELDPR